MPFAFGLRRLHLQRIGVRARFGCLRGFLDPARLRELARRVVVLLRRCVIAFAVNVLLGLLAPVLLLRLPAAALLAAAGALLVALRIKSLLALRTLLALLVLLSALPALPVLLVAHCASSSVAACVLDCAHTGPLPCP